LVSFIGLSLGYQYKTYTKRENDYKIKERRHEGYIVFQQLPSDNAREFDNNFFARK